MRLQGFQLTENGLCEAATSSAPALDLSAVVSPLINALAALFGGRSTEQQPTEANGQVATQVSHS